MFAGQAVVQIAEDVHSRQQYAAKFFLSRQAFEQEAKLYEDPDQPLGRFLPECRAIVDPAAGRGCYDKRGNALPPCIVMERGEALDNWAARSDEGVDFVTGLQVCFSMCLCNSVTAYTIATRCMMLVCSLAHSETQCTVYSRSPQMVSLSALMHCTENCVDLSDVSTGADTCGGEVEEPACCGLRASRHQARQHHVAAAQEPLDTHRLWLRGKDRHVCVLRFQRFLRTPRASGSLHRRCCGPHYHLSNRGRWVMYSLACTISRIGCAHTRQGTVSPSNTEFMSPELCIVQNRWIYLSGSNSTYGCMLYLNRTGPYLWPVPC